MRHGGGSIGASTCVVTVGAWAGESLVRSAVGGDPRLPELTVTQEQVAYFRPISAGPAPPGRPSSTGRSRACTGCRHPDGLVKIGEHHTGTDHRRRIEVGRASTPTTWERLQRWVADHVPGVEPSPVRSATCLYASYPGDTFLFDRVGPVVIGLGLSGHGFKFVPEIGRRLADLSQRIHDPDNPFSLDRPPIVVGASGRR